VYSLLDVVDSESIVDGFRIGVHSDKYDFTNQLKIAVREGLDSSNYLAELEDKKLADGFLKHMTKSRFSALTNDRAVVVVVRLLFALLHGPRLYHQRTVQRKRLGG
jgi:hypothetical protein